MVALANQIKLTDALERELGLREHYQQPSWPLNQSLLGEGWAVTRVKSPLEDSFPSKHDFDEASRALMIGAMLLVFVIALLLATFALLR